MYKTHEKRELLRDVNATAYPTCRVLAPSLTTYIMLVCCSFLYREPACVGPRERHFRKCGKVLTIYITELAFVLQNDENTVSQ